MTVGKGVDVRSRHSKTAQLLLVLAIGSAGCHAVPAAGPVAHPPSTVPARTSVRAVATRPTTPSIQRPPLLLHLPGIGGERTIDQSMVRGLVEGGFTGNVQIYDWTEGDSGIPALRATARNRRQAGVIAAALVARHAADPTARIYLTSHSGGAGLAVWALEDLPPDVRIQDLLLMSPALSPSYDLSRALSHVNGKAYVFFSTGDELILGYGTRMFGTIDGVQCDAAGRVGFVRPESADAAEYRKLVQVPYEPAWVRYHDYGDHIGGMNRSFARQVLAPLLLAGRMPPTTQPTSLSHGHP